MSDEAVGGRGHAAAVLVTGGVVTMTGSGFPRAFTPEVVGGTDGPIRKATLEHA